MIITVVVIVSVRPECTGPDPTTTGLVNCTYFSVNKIQDLRGPSFDTGVVLKVTKIPVLSSVGEGLVPRQTPTHPHQPETRVTTKTKKGGRFLTSKT